MYGKKNYEEGEYSHEEKYGGGNVKYKEYDNGEGDILDEKYDDGDVGVGDFIADIDGYTLPAEDLPPIYEGDEKVVPDIDPDSFESCDMPSTKFILPINRILNLIKVSNFKQLVNENYDRCIMPEVNYDINERIIMQWKKCLQRRYVNELSKTKKEAKNTDFLPQNNKEISSLTKQDGENILRFADAVHGNMFRISFKQLLLSTKKITDELISLLQNNEYKNHEIVIVIDNHLYSSNTWYTILLTKALFDHPKIAPRIVNIIDKVSEFQDGVQLPPIGTPDSELLQEMNLGIKSSFLRYKNTFFIHADDMSYSGQQLLGHIPTGLKYLFKCSGKNKFFHREIMGHFKLAPNIQRMVGYTTNRYYIAIPYIGSQAIATYFPELESYNILIKEGKRERSFYNESMFILPSSIHVVASLAHHMNNLYGEEINNSIHETLYKPYFHKLFKYSTGSLPIFFDHKLADAVSTLTYIISFSSCSTIDKKDIIIGHMVKSCKAPPISEIVDDNTLKGTEVYDFSKEKNRCPESFYKHLVYTFNKVAISKKKFGIKDTQNYMGLALLESPFLS